MYNSGGDRIGIQSSRLKPINEEESKDFHTVRSNFCKDNYKVVIWCRLIYRKVKLKHTLIMCMNTARQGLGGEKRVKEHLESMSYGVFL